VEKKENKINSILKRVGYFLWKHKVAVILLFAVIIGISVFMKIRSNEGKKEAVQKEAFIQTTTLTKRDITTSVSVTGTIASADERNVSTNLKDVEVTEVKVAVGDYVKAGDTIVVFDSDDLEDSYESAKDEYELNTLKENQSLSQAQDNVDEARSNYEKGVEEQQALVNDALSEYNTAVSDEATALSNYETAQENTKNAKTNYNKLKEKKSSLKKAMEKAEKANKKSQETLSKAKSEYETAEANVKYASENDANYQTLYHTYTDAYNAYQTAQAEASKTESEYEKAKKEYESVEESKKAYEDAQAKEEESKNLYEQACTNSSNKYSQYEKSVDTQTQTNEKNEKNIEESKENLTITSKEISNSAETKKEQLQEAEEQLGKCVVTSPITGVITSMNVEVGDTYDGASDLFVVQDMSNFVVDATVDEYDIADLSKGQEAVVKTDATEDEEFSGIVTYVAPTPDSNNGDAMGSSSSTSNYTIQITLNETSDRLRVGMTAKTSILLESAKDIYAIAYDCIETDEQGNSYITVIDDGGNAPISYSKEKSEKDSVSENSGEKPGRMPKGEMPSGERPEGMPEGEMPSDTETSTKKIYVELGMESDYYVEIISDELYEGMRVVTPTTVNNSSSNSDDESGFEMNIMGGGMPGGGNRGGGMPSGGGPGGF